MNKERYMNYRNNLVTIFTASVISAIICLLGFLLWNMAITYFLGSVFFAIMAFLSGWRHIYKHGQEFDDEFNEFE